MLLPSPSLRAKLIVPTFSEFVSTPCTSTTPPIPLRALHIVLSATLIQSVLTYDELGVIAPLSSAVAIVKDLIIDPGSNGVMVVLSTNTAASLAL